MTTFGYIRHGETDWNVLHKLQGRADIALNDRGIQQAKNAQALLQGQGFTKIVTSPLARAKQTTEILNEVLELEVIVEQDLMEIDFGSAEGRIRQDIVNDAVLAPDKYHAHTVFPFPVSLDAEDLMQFDARIQNGILGNVRKHPQDKILFVGHGGFFLNVQKILLGTERIIESKNAVPYQFLQNNDVWSISEVNSPASHLKQSHQTSFAL